MEKPTSSVFQAIAAQIPPWNRSFDLTDRRTNPHCQLRHSASQAVMGGSSWSKAHLSFGNNQFAQYFAQYKYAQYKYAQQRFQGKLDACFQGTANGNAKTNGMTCDEKTRNKRSQRE